MALTLGREYFGGPGTHPEIQRMVDHAIDLTLKAGKWAMLPIPTGAEAREVAQRGVQLITLNFGVLVRGACEGYLKTARG
jgi:hypothetical protein